MKKFVIVLFAAVSLNAVWAQEQNHWSAHTVIGQLSPDEAVARPSFPRAFKLFDLNAGPLRNELFALAGKTATGRSINILLPNAAGQIERFQVFEASNFEPDLQVRFPEIRAFSGRGITDKYATLKLSISPQGLQTIVFRTGKENEFIEPYSRDHKVYAVFTSQRFSGRLPWSCTTPAEILPVNAAARGTGTPPVLRSTGDLKTLRLAQSVTAEYSNYFGATNASQAGLVLAAINATLTRANGVYERDLAVHLNLISATTRLIYYNPSTDPYSPAFTGVRGKWNRQLQSTLTAVIGEANYDIGHLFGASGGGGNAGCIGCICVNGSKGSGFTSPADGNPQGDIFDIDYVVHEIGHQLGANHTFSSTNEGSGVNKEVGSGITVMGYAGVTSQDVAAHSIDVFHQASIAQIQANLVTKTCPVTTIINNAAPAVTPMVGYIIPRSTPFALTGSAMDADTTDMLTYSWEQNDNASALQTGAGSVASVTKASGPNFISFRPAISPTRYLPQLSTILSGGLITGPLSGGDAGANSEALNSVARTLNFRLTVRDNAPYSSASPLSVGQSTFTDMAVMVSPASGPFMVTVLNSAVSYPGGSAQNITWSVAGTTAAPVSCANVKISLSIDGGQTFLTVLAESTPNDGIEKLVMPTTATTTGRIKIEAVGNIFFDISDNDFTITGTADCQAPAELTVFAVGNNTAAVSWTSVANALSYTVEYRPDTSAIWTTFSAAQTDTFANLAALSPGSLYYWRVSANCLAGSSNKTELQFTTTSPFVCAPPAGLTASAISTSGATINWSAVSGAMSYAVEYKLATATAFTPATAATPVTAVILSGLTPGSVYNYRVGANCGVYGVSDFTAAQFTTNANGCQSLYDVNSNGTTGGAAAIPFNSNVTGLIDVVADVDYYKFMITTGGTITIILSGLPADYDLKLLNSAGTQVAVSQNGNRTSEVITYTAAPGTYFVQVYGYRNANSATGCYTLKAALGSAGRPGEMVANSADTRSMSVFPNPARAKLSLILTGYDGIYKVELFDVNGRQVSTRQTSKKYCVLDISTLAKGIYFLKVITPGGEVLNRKIVKE